jgi:hypothetical protein
MGLSGTSPPTDNPPTEPHGPEFRAYRRSLSAKQNDERTVFYLGGGSACKFRLKVRTVSKWTKFMTNFRKPLYHQKLCFFSFWL